MAEGLSGDEMREIIGSAATRAVRRHGEQLRAFFDDVAAAIAARKAANAAADGRSAS